MALKNKLGLRLHSEELKTVLGAARSNVVGRMVVCSSPQLQCSSKTCFHDRVALSSNICVLVLWLVCWSEFHFCFLSVISFHITIYVTWESCSPNSITAFEKKINTLPSWNYLMTCICINFILYHMSSDLCCQPCTCQLTWVVPIMAAYSWWIGCLHTSILPHTYCEICYHSNHIPSIFWQCICHWA